MRTLVSQAVAELHLGRTEEAQAALDQAMQKEPQFAEAIANLLVLSVITGKDATDVTKYVIGFPVPVPCVLTRRQYPEERGCATSALD